MSSALVEGRNTDGGGLNSERDNTRKRKDPRRSLEAPSVRSKSGRESIGLKSNEAKVYGAANSVNAVLRLPFFRDSEVLIMLML